MRLALLLLLTASFAATSAPGLAQRAANLSGRDIPASERARDTMNRFAICIVKARPNMVREALAQPFGPARISALNNVVKKECLAGGTLRMDPGILEGALYRALYFRDFGEDHEMAPVAMTVPTSASDSWQTFGDCVVRTDPRNAQAFLLADPATPEEAAALEGVRPALAACISPEQQVGFSPARLQAVLARALYQRATFEATPAASAARETAE